MQKVNIYLETNIRGLNRTVGWYGYTMEYIDSHGGKHTREGHKCEMGVTPNMLILMAFCAALNRLTKSCRITVYTDSVYLRESCEKRLMHWKENGWKTAHNESIKNRDLWQQVSEKLDMHVILFGAEEDNEYRERMKAELADRRAGNV